MDEEIEYWHFSFHRKTFRRKPVEIVNDTFGSDVWAGTMFQLIKFLKLDDQNVGENYYQTTTIIHSAKITLAEMNELEI